jgi:hypothetical protein
VFFSHTWNAFHSKKFSVPNAMPESNKRRSALPGLPFNSFGSSSPHREIFWVGISARASGMKKQSEDLKKNGKEK